MSSSPRARRGGSRSEPPAGRGPGGPQVGVERRASGSRSRGRRSCAGSRAGRRYGSRPRRKARPASRRVAVVHAVVFSSGRTLTASSAPVGCPVRTGHCHRRAAEGRRRRRGAHQRTAPDSTTRRAASSSALACVSSRGLDASSPMLGCECGRERPRPHGGKDEGGDARASSSSPQRQAATIAVASPRWCAAAQLLRKRAGAPASRWLSRSMCATTTPPRSGGATAKKEPSESTAMEGMHAEDPARSSLVAVFQRRDHEALERPPPARSTARRRRGRTSSTRGDRAVPRGVRVFPACTTNASRRRGRGPPRPAPPGRSESTSSRVGATERAAQGGQKDR